MTESSLNPTSKLRRGSPTISMLGCGMAIAMVTIIAGSAAFLHSRLIGLMEDFDVDLPVLTLLYLKVQPWQALLAGTLAVVVLAMKEALIADKHVTTVINLVMMFILIILGSLLGYAYLMPMVKLMQSVL